MQLCAVLGGYRVRPFNLGLIISAWHAGRRTMKCLCEPYDLPLSVSATYANQVQYTLFEMPTYVDNC